MCYFNGIKVSCQDYIRLQNIQKKLENLQLSYPVVSGFEYGRTPVIKPTGNGEWDIVANGMGLYSSLP